MTQGTRGFVSKYFTSNVFSGLCVLAIGGTLLWGSTLNVLPPEGRSSATIAAKPLPDTPLLLGQAPLEGSPKAKAGLVVYSDFECPFCRRFARGALQELRHEYVERGQLSLVFRHLPLTDIHPNARAASEAVSCAAQQGRSWQLHDQLFAASEITKQLLRDQVKVLGLDEPAFHRCLSAEGPQVVDADLASAHALNVTSTVSTRVSTCDGLTPGLHVDTLWRVDRT
jgi:protein-disulfide isomerase